MFGEKTFKGMYLEIKSLKDSNQMTEDEANQLEKDVIKPFLENYSSFIRDILIRGIYKEISGSGSKKLITPRDWAAAIRNLIRIISLANQAYTIQLNKILDPIKRKERCNSISDLSKCKPPCSIKTSITGRHCTM
jgi:hypothetical protein